MKVKVFCYFNSKPNNVVLSFHAKPYHIVQRKYDSLLMRIVGIKPCTYDGEVSTSIVRHQANQFVFNLVLKYLTACA